MEKPGGPEGAPRRLNPKSPIKAGFDQTLGGTARWRGWPASAREALRRSPHFARKPAVLGHTRETIAPALVEGISRGAQTRVRGAESRYFAGTCASTAPRKRGGCVHSLCSWRLSDSTSSDSETSLVTNASILRTACRTVVWSRPPKRRPISGSERSVRVLARYIAT